MLKKIALNIAATAIALVGTVAYAAEARNFNIPPGDLAPALESLAKETGLELIFQPAELKGIRTQGATGTLSPQEAVAKLIDGTRLTIKTDSAGAILISSATNAPVKISDAAQVADLRLTQSEIQTMQKIETSSSSGDSEDSKGIPEIVVTAQKRQERLIETPQSVTVLSADDLAKLGATQFRDFAGTIPGLTFTSGGAGFNQISLRGITTGLDISSTVGVYVDEVPYGSSSAFARGARFTHDGGLFDIARIEVLRGPQGTLYGASTMGGLIKYVSRLPDTHKFFSEVEAGTSSTQHGGVNYNVAAALNAPISAGKVAVRISGFETHDGGYVDNVTLGQDDVNQADLYGGRADLLFLVSDALTVRLTGVLQNVSRDGTGTVDFSPGLTGAPLAGSEAQLRPIAEPYEQRFRLLSGTVTYELDAATLTSISSYQTVKTDVVYDLSPSLVASFAASGPFGGVAQFERPDTDKFTQEIRLASAADARPLEWVIGGFYTYEDSNRRLEYRLINPAGQPVANTLLNLAAPSTYEEYAAFGDLTWHLTNQFDVTGGVRYASNRQAYAQNATGSLARPAPIQRSEDNVLTYLANARYRFGEHATGYLRYATGYRPGGPNYIGINPATGLPTLGNPTFEPDRLESYEIGYKTETSDRRFGMDISAYRIDWKNLQVFDLRNAFGGLINASAARVRGSELSLTARPIGELSVIGAFAYQDAQMSAAETSLGALKGDRLVNVPRITASLNGDYTFSDRGVQPTFGTTLRYVSERKTAYTNTAASRQHTLPDYATLDVRAGLTLGRIDAQLYVHNLFDERGEVSGLVFAGRPQVAIVQPRTVGISVRTQF